MQIVLKVKYKTKFSSSLPTSPSLSWGCSWEATMSISFSFFFYSIPFSVLPNDMLYYCVNILNIIYWYLLFRDEDLSSKYLHLLFLSPLHPLNNYIIGEGKLMLMFTLWWWCKYYLLPSEVMYPDYVSFLYNLFALGEEIVLVFVCF